MPAMFSNTECFKTDIDLEEGKYVDLFQNDTGYVDKSLRIALGALIIQT